MWLLGILIAFFVVVYIIYFMYINGEFGLYVHVNINKRKVYYRYKGKTINSFTFNLDDTEENILAKKEKYKKESKSYIKKIKNLNK
mgnify:CR=1 FL=1